MTRTRMENGVEIALTPEEETQRDAEEKLWDEKQVELAKTQYQRDRALDYASLQDQADMQYWDAVNGTTLWQEHIAEIKAKHPKE